MTKKCTASNTIGKAAFFLQKAGDAENREDFANFIEAAVVFARSVTFHLQKEFNNCPGFNDWHSEKQKEMQQNPVCRFFLTTCNYILKEGPISIGKRLQVEFTAVFNIEDAVTAEVVRRTPWYRRKPRLLFDDVK